MPSTQPNIIFIITDQQRYDTIRALGYPYMDTPHMDRLVREGVTFTNSHITAPLCSPSRASLFTGYYPHTTGIYGNENLWRHSWVELLNQAGYYCVNVGKMHTYPFETPCGFHERYVVENKDRYFAHRFYFDEWDKALRARGLIKPAREINRARPDYHERLGAFEWELPEDAHSDFFVGDMVNWWLETKPKPDRPLFLQIGFPGPHPPYDPIPRYAEPYLARDLPPAKVTEEELANLPPPLKAQRENCVEYDRDSIAYTLTPTSEQIHRQRALYLANVTMIDEKIGEILETLERHGYLEDAVVVLTSDHGDCLSDHGQSQKACMYDVITRVPLIVWAPGRFTCGRTINALCQQMDVGPALLELAGIEVPEAFEAQSLLPALEGEPLRRRTEAVRAQGKFWEGREVVFAELPKRGRDGGPSLMTMARDRAWKLVHFSGESYGQLFDLAHDPDELHNLWDDPAAAAHKRRLLDALLEWRIDSQYHTRDLAKDWR